MEAQGFDPALVAVAREAVIQERTHVALCAEIAERFGGRIELGEAVVEEIAPRSFAPRDRAIYDAVAFCCITETANAAVVTAGADDITDAAIRRSVRVILADEVQHSRLGWRFLATHPLDDRCRAWLARYLPDILEGTVRADLFSPDAAIPGDEDTMAHFGTLPVAGRRQAFLDGMREVALPGLAQHGVDIAPALAFLDELSRRSLRSDA